MVTGVSLPVAWPTFAQQTVRTPAMYHRSRRSVSNPRGKKALGTTSRSTTPQPARGEQPSKPAWDDTYGDLSKYKLTPEQVARRKQQRVSKHFVPLDSSRRQSLAGDWAADSHRDKEEHTGTATPEGTPQPGSKAQAVTTSPHDDVHDQASTGAAASPPINYGAVLQLLNRRTSLSSNGAGAGSHRETPPAVLSPPSANPPLQAQQPRQGTLDMSSPVRGTSYTQSPPTASASSQGATHQRGSAMLHAPIITSSPDHLAHQSARAQPAAAHGAPSAAVTAAANSASALADLTSQLQASLRHTESKQQQLDSRVRGLETSMATALSVQQQQARALATPNPGMTAELAQLKSTVTQVASEQASLREELRSFTSHATTLISKLQTQIQQIFRLQDRGLTSGVPPSPALTAAPMPSSVAADLMQQLPSHSLFQDLPSTGTSMSGRSMLHASSQPPAPSAAPRARSLAAGPVVSSIPATNFEDQIALPSYSSMRRSQGAGIRGQLGPTGAAGPEHRPSAAPTAAVLPFQQQQFGADSASTGAPAARVPASIAMTSPGSTALAAAAADLGLGPEPGALASSSWADVQAEQGRFEAGAASGHRVLPSQYQPRSLRTGAPLLSQGLAGAVAAAGADLAALGIQLPISQHGPALGSVASMGTAAVVPGAVTGVSTGAAGMQGSSLAGFPEPLNFTQPADFRILRVGGNAGPGAHATASMSLAAHTAAAARQQVIRKQHQK